MADPKPITVTYTASGAYTGKNDPQPYTIVGSSPAVAAKTQVIALSASSAADGVAAAGANPTKAEYDAVVTLANDLKTKVNAIIAALKA